MKGTERFKEAIKNYLDKRAESDELFAKRYAETTRTIDDIVTYILNQVKASGMCGFTDSEVYSLAVHAIDEPNLEIGKPITCQVVVNHQVQLTEEEIKEAKAKAMAQVMKEESERIRKPKATPKPKAQTESVKQPELSLFDF